MSTLLIEGGRPLSGRIVGGRQQERGAAADCGVPAHRRGVRAHQRAAHRRRRGDGAAARRPRRRGGRHRHQHAAHPVPRRSSATSRRAGWSAGCAARCCCSARCSRVAARARLAPPGGDFPARRTIAMHLNALEGDGRARAGRGGARARGAGRPVRRVDVPRGGVGHRHRDGAAGRRGRARRHRDPPRRLRAARRRTVRSSSGRWARA